MRAMEWAEIVCAKYPEGHYVQDIHFESNEIHSRKLWRLPGLSYSSHPGIQEGFRIEKTNLMTSEKDCQLFITNRPAIQWGHESILNRILLHWDTETGVFGIKDNTFQEDKVRYKTVAGAMGHVAMLNVAWNCLYAPVFESYWPNKPMSCRIQFFKDHPEYSPLA